MSHQIDDLPRSSKLDGPFPFNKTRWHSRPRTPEPVPVFFWPLMTFLLSLSVSLICWAVYNTFPLKAAGPENHLRQALVSPKFTYAGVQGPELLPAPEPDEPVVVANRTGEPPLLHLPGMTREHPAPVLAAPSVTIPKFDWSMALEAAPPPPLQPPPLEPPPLPTQTAIQPANMTVPAHPVVSTQLTDTVPRVYHDSTSGDTPMLRNWKTLALYSLLTTTVFVQVPLPAAADDKAILERIESLNKTIKDATVDIKEDIKSIKEDVAIHKAALQKAKDDAVEQGLGLNRKIRDMETTLKVIRADLDALSKREGFSDKANVDKAGLDDFRAKLDTIHKALLNLQPSSNRVSMSPAAPPTTGRVILVNLYPESLLFTINQREFRVMPGASLPVENVPAGSLTYEVMSANWGVRARRTTALAANETFTLTAQ